MKAKAITLVLTMFVVSAGVWAQQDPAVGTWKLNLAKSKYSPGPAPKANTMKIEPYGKGGQMVTTDGANAQGAPTHLEWSGEFDGKDYPLKGSQAADTASAKRIDPNTVEFRGKKGAKVTVTTRGTVSKDGKTTTATTTGRNAKGQRIKNVEVYDKQ